MMRQNRTSNASASHIHPRSRCSAVLLQTLAGISNLEVPCHHRDDELPMAGDPTDARTRAPPLPVTMLCARG
jgi:hypothetical protein